MERKSQVSMEFLFAVVFVLLILILLLGFVFQRKSELADTKDFLDKKAECLRVASLVSSVYSAGEGTTANINTDYLVTIYNDSSIKINSSNPTNTSIETEARCYFAVEIQPYQLTGNLTIKNVNGQLFITK